MSAEQDRLLAEGPRLAAEPPLAGDPGAAPASRAQGVDRVGRPHRRGLATWIGRMFLPLAFGSLAVGQAVHSGRLAGLAFAVLWLGVLGLGVAKMRRRSS